MGFADLPSGIFLGHYIRGWHVYARGGGGISWERVPWALVEKGMGLKGQRVEEKI